MRTLLSVFRFLLCCWNDHRLDDRVRFEWLVGLVVRKTEENIKRDDWSLETGEDKALVLAPVCGAREKNRWKKLSFSTTNEQCCEKDITGS